MIDEIKYRLTLCTLWFCAALTIASLSAHYAAYAVRSKIRGEK
jgi:hypothetical protein